MNKINWIEECKNYLEFLNFEKEDIKTEEEAKKIIREEIENIIAINGEDYLYERERDLLKLLNNN